MVLFQTNQNLSGGALNIFAFLMAKQPAHLHLKVLCKKVT
jgi:hypothetical protein